MNALYSLVATTMQRLGIQPITHAEIEIIENRRHYPGRRKTDGLASFLIDHFILDALQLAVLVFLYSLLNS